MELSTEVRESIDRSVLCWLATVGQEGSPNVSPKEIFNHYGEDQIIIANIASPGSVRNIKAHDQVCLNFVDILRQKGFKLKGRAQICEKGHPEFQDMEKVLTEMTQGKFPFTSIIRVNVDQVSPILAPSYLFFPETTEEQQIASAQKSYGLE